MVCWSPDSDQVLVAPTFIAGDGVNAAGLAGEAAAIVDVASGAIAQLDIAPADVQTLVGARWASRDRIETDLRDGRTLVLRRHGGAWRSEAAIMRERGASEPAPIRVELREDMNSPPRLYAIDSATGAERMVRDLNPGLAERFALGQAETLQWTAADGLIWAGRLYPPADLDGSRRYPLVIQTHGGAAPGAFSLYGMSSPAGLGPRNSVYLAQALASHGIAVLQVPDIRPPLAADRASEAPGIMARAYEGAIEVLVALGLADRDRVGLMGFSRTGWHVEHTLANTDFPYAAAIADDNIDAGYMQGAALGWDRAQGEANNGAPPFGEGVAAWLENAPPFNADRVRAPLLMMGSDSPGSLGSVYVAAWEMFSRLRRLERPVELYVAPNVLRGSHGLQNPRQLLAVQERAFDWWLFWLKGEESADAAKREQYAQWRMLRAQRDAVLRHPRRPRFDWRATPVR